MDDVVLGRFEARYVPVPYCGCWLWDAAASGAGYGQIWSDGDVQYAHRLSYEHYAGPIPSGMAVCHACDVPACVNPDHLFLGSDADNARDKSKKGRCPHGSGHWNARLAESDVSAIRRRLRAGESCTSIAADFGVHRYTVSDIKLGKSWRHVT